MLVVAFRMQVEVGSAPRARREAIVLDEARQLRARHVRLGRLDGVENCARLERILSAPGIGTAACLRRRGAVERRVEGGGELVPEVDVSRLFGGVLAVAGCGCGVGEGDDRVTVLARVEGEIAGR